MDYSGTLIAAARHLWRHKQLWGFGLVLAGPILAGELLGQALRPWVLELLAASSPDLLFRSFERVASPAALIRLTVALVAAGLLVWLLTAVAEASLIVGVAAAAGGARVSFGQGLRQGLALLGRLVAVDTLLFLPLFLVALVGLLLAALTLLGAVALTAPGGGSPRTMVVLVLAGFGLELGLLLLALMVTVFTLMFRVLAFRAVALADQGARGALRVAWRLFRDHWRQILILALILWGLGRVIDLLLTAFSAPLTFALMAQMLPASAGPAALRTLPWWLRLLELSLSLLRVLGQAILSTFAVAAWTVAVSRWLTSPRPAHRPALTPDTG